MPSNYDTAQGGIHITSTTGGNLMSTTHARANKVIDGKLIGFVERMPFEEYLAVDALSGSSLMPMRRSPLTFVWNRDNPQAPTDAMKLGTVIHTAILEPPLLGKIAVWGLT